MVHFLLGRSPIICPMGWTMMVRLGLINDFCWLLLSYMWVSTYWKTNSGLLLGTDVQYIPRYFHTVCALLWLGTRWLYSYQTGLHYWHWHCEATCKYINELVQERCNFSALAMELHLSCTYPSIWVNESHKSTRIDIKTTTGDGITK